MASVCCLSATEKEALRRSKAIDRQLKRESKTFIPPIKVLLLGPDESGKSTFLQQMRILHGRDYPEQDRIKLRGSIYHNILKNAKILVEAHRKLEIPLENPRNEEHGQLIVSYHRDHNLSPEEFQSFVDALTSLWKDSGIQTTVKQTYGLRLSDSVIYFLNSLNVIGAIDYVPSTEDVLYLLKPTCGVQQHVVEIKGVSFLFADDHNPLQHKWFRFVEDVTSVMFFVDCSKFDQTLHEDRSTNYLDESVSVFDMIVNNRFLQDASMILFFSNTDLLSEKIKVKSIKDYFQDFCGDPQNLGDVQTYIGDRFNSVRLYPSQELYRHFTTATDTSSIGLVFEMVKETILTDHIQKIMRDSGSV